jgi:alkylation response protein AidB-like acyl-CoA dehydrogenase
VTPKLDPALIKAYFEMGLMGIQAPEAHGGAGGSVMMVTLAVEEISKVDAASAILVDVQNTLVTNAVLKSGSEAMKKKYLPHLAQDWVGSYALSESSSGSDAFALKLKAEDKGTHWLLNGHKLWITSAHEANLFLVFANTDFSKGYKGITAFLVERGFAGVSRSARRRTSSASVPRAPAR